jgi:hypothetical protein
MAVASKTRCPIRLLSAAAVLATLCASQSSAQTPVVVDRRPGLQLIVVEENTLPTLKILLPGEAVSSQGVLVVFPEHVTVREHGKTEPVHLYLWQPGQRGNRTAWRQVGHSLEYEMDLERHVHMLARATLDSDGVRYHYELVNRSDVDYDSVQAISDPRLYRSSFRDVRLERTYVHRKGGFELLASDTPARLTMSLSEWLPCRYLDSYTWPVPPPGERARKAQGITYYNASRPVDEPFIATLSQDGECVAATCTLECGNVWTNPELTCQHADPDTSLKGKGKASLEGKTFVLKGTLDQVLRKVEQERKRWANEAGALR